MWAPDSVDLVVACWVSVDAVSASYRVGLPLVILKLTSDVRSEMKMYHSDTIGETDAPVVRYVCDVEVKCVGTAAPLGLGPDAALIDRAVVTPKCVSLDVIESASVPEVGGGLSVGIVKLGTEGSGKGGCVWCGGKTALALSVRKDCIPMCDGKLCIVTMTLRGDAPIVHALIGTFDTEAHTVALLVVTGCAWWTCSP